ncbi:MAG: hypothetical protein QM679_03900 [Patulibacter sp.]
MLRRESVLRQPSGKLLLLLFGGASGLGWRRGVRAIGVKQRQRPLLRWCV